MRRPLQGLNAGKPYSSQIKPFNFVLSCHVKVLGRPLAVDPERFHLIAPYEKDPRKWASLPWIDQYSGKYYGVSMSGPHGTRAATRVKTHGDVLREYEHHAESKCADTTERRHISRRSGFFAAGMCRSAGCASSARNQIGSKKSIKASRRSRTSRISIIRMRGATSGTVVTPIIRAMPLNELLRLSGLSRAPLQAIRAGRRPHAKNRAMLTTIANDQRPHFQASDDRCLATLPARELIRGSCG